MPKTSLTPVPTPAELGRMVKGLREYNKWSQATLAELAGVAERTVQRVSTIHLRCNLRPKQKASFIAQDLIDFLKASAHSSKNAAPTSEISVLRTPRRTSS